jgi:phosphoglycolate phosphatase-like HAD superfamily hydrolase
LAKKIILALDFDGVIANNLRERTIIAFKAFNALGEKLELNKQNEKKVIEAAFLVQGIRDLYSLLECIKKNPREKFSEKHLKIFQRKRNRKKNKDFEEEFKRQRKLLMKNKEYWMSLQFAYSGIKRVIEKLGKKVLIVIVTSKPKRFAVELIKNYGLKIDSKKIFDKGFAEGKATALKKISKIFNIPLKRIVLVDDLLENLIGVKRIGAIPLMAEWGYSRKKDIKKAKLFGIKTVKKPEELLKIVERLYQNY